MCRDQVCQGSGQCTPLIGWGQFKQVSDVSGVQRADEVAHFLGMSFIDMIEHSRNKFGLQPVVFVESCVVGQNVVFGLLRRIGCAGRSEEHTSELQSLMRISYAVFCLKKKNTK